MSDIRVDVVIPVLNEAHVLEASVATVREFLQKQVGFKWRIVVVDNGSTDGTLKVAENLAETFDDVACVHLKERGRGRALRESWRVSTADIVLYTDVDLSTELAALPKLVYALGREGYDIAIGSRLAKGANTKRCLKREITSRAYNVILKCLLFVKFKDAQCGFKAVTRRIVEDLVPQVKDQSWFFDTELLVLAERRGYRIKEIPVTWIEDDDSRVRIVPTAWEDMKGVFRLRWLFVKEKLARVGTLKPGKAHERPPAERISNAPRQ
ncbi:MAG: glycosyltransferase family 2 protein [Acidobacteriia bacterium]|nr:glycosyltransferase family 2 protein [Terriglobia bacterium]